MFGREKTHKHVCIDLRDWAAIAGVVILFASIAAAQDLTSPVPSLLPGAWPLQRAQYAGLNPFASTVFTPARPAEVRFDNAAAATVGDVEEQTGQSGRSREVTLEQVKQQSANRAASPMAYMAHLSVEAAKQHRLGVQADYFPKFSATFVNLHFTDFLGQIIQVRHPFQGTITQVPVAIINQDQTIAALSFVQPITPLLVVRQAVKIARADERIAMAKAVASTSRNLRGAEVEETYFKLLIAQRQLTSAEFKLKSGGRTLYASTSNELVSTTGPGPEALEAAKALETVRSTVKELTASLNQIMGWPENTELELAVPDALVESISLQEVSDKMTATNPALVEAEETVVKARAAESISKMAYFPTVAAVAGYLFQNTLPAVNSNVGYGGVMASYTLFDFGKREHAVKEARAQLGMAETALQLTKAKLASDVKKSYLELERSRQLSHVAQKMGASSALLMKVSSERQSLEVRAARADIEVEMLEADFAHRQAYNKFRALAGER